MIYNFTTFFDKSYLARGLVLYDSLYNKCEKFNLYILCLDDYTFYYLNNLFTNTGNVTLIRLFELETFDKELFNCKINRNLIEYYFTISPCLPIYILKKFNIDHICLIDADLFFLNSPKIIFEKLNNYSIIITKHDFSIENISSEKYGKFNVSFQIFKNNNTGNICLNNWRYKCIQSCNDFYDPINKTFADQLYLDEWEILYKNDIYLLDSSNCGLAPWNYNKCNIIFRNNTFYNGDTEIIFLHFHGLKYINDNIFLNSFKDYKVKNTKNLSFIYKIYITELLLKIKKVDLFEESNIRYKFSYF